MSPSRLFPFLGWMRQYDRAHAREDVAAGLTTAVMLIPQAMAYAMLAGLPPIIGLYASTLPLVVYSLMGSSRELAVGPVAMVSLMVATALTPLAEAGSESYVALAVVLALLVGVIQTAMGVLRAGFLVNFLSHPVVSGFTSAAALIIGFSQLTHLLGFKIPRSHHVHTILLTALEKIGEVNMPTILIGAVSIAALMILKKVAPKWPRALIVVVVTTLAVWGFDLPRYGVKIVGEVPAGLPALAMPELDGGVVSQLLPTAILISLVGFMESISVAKAFASRRRYEIDANQELVGLGLANVVGGLFRGYPVTGGFSRTAVNAQAGARSGVAGLVTAGVVIVTLLLLTDLFYFLPKATLAAVIMTAVFGLVDVDEVKHLWHVDRADLTLLVLTFLSTLTLGIEPGIGIGVGASLLWFVVRTTRPHTAVLGRLPGTTAFRNLDRFDDATKIPGVLALRIDASFYFGNVAFLKETLGRELGADPDIKAVIIDATSINRLDSSADAALREIERDLSERGIELHFAGIKGPVRDTMGRSGLAKALGEERMHLSVHDAVLAATT